MKLPQTPRTAWSNINARLLLSRRKATFLPKQGRNGFFTSRAQKRAQRRRQQSTLPLALITGGLFIWWLYPSDDFARLSPGKYDADRSRGRRQGEEDGDGDDTDQSAWASFTRRFESFPIMTDKEWSTFSDRLVDYIVPDWSRLIPGYLRKLQNELSMSPGSLADEIWQEAHDPSVNPEIQYAASVRVSQELCDEEKEYLARRKKVAKVALAKYLDLDENDIHPEDVPTIAMCGSGGGLRALIAGTGSLLATEEDGLYDCVTYTAGVSGSCWLQMLYLSTFTRGKISALAEHLKARAGIHIAYPPVAFQSLVSLPTSKYLLSGMVEKLRGDPKADFGLVDIYGLLLGARYLVPKGELGVDNRDLKISSQREYIKYGEFPLPIYTAVRHEIPELDKDPATTSPIEIDRAKQKAKDESWFQWYEITPYEFFCEELHAGIPTWALGRKFSRGKDVPLEHGFHLPELRTPVLMGIFGSAFCATLSHYYREIRPLVKSMSGFEAVDDLISGRNEDLSKVHPIDPATIPNFAYQMQGLLPYTTPQSLYDKQHIQLMDAGMSNNLPIYPLLRPGRQVDIVVTFDASADVKTDNWLSVVDGYARQRGIKGWPVGIGWPQSTKGPTQTAKELEEAQAKSTAEAEKKIQEARNDQKNLRKDAGQNGTDAKPDSDHSKSNIGTKEGGDLGYCTVWVGSTHERKTDPPPPSKAITSDTSWELLEPDAGVTVVYLPFLSNDKVPDVSPGSSDFLSTWNFVYTPDQIDQVVRLARANYSEGKQQIRDTVRAVYERKKKMRLEAEKDLRKDKLRTIAARGEAALLGEGDQFS